MRVSIRNFEFVNGVLSFDMDSVGDNPPTPPEPDRPPTNSLPEGYDSDLGVGFEMFKQAMEKHGLTPRGVQGHGQWIVDAMNDTWPEWNVWLSKYDSPVVPGFGSLDVTIDSGKGGWEFSPDGYVKYDERG